MNVLPSENLMGQLSILFNMSCWVVTLATVSYPIAIFCSFWFVFVKPLSFIEDRFTNLSKLLERGASLPYICLEKMQYGEMFFNFREGIEFLQTPIKKGKSYYHQLCTPDRPKNPPLLADIPEEEQSTSKQNRST